MTFQTHQAVLIVKGHLDICALIADYLQYLGGGMQHEFTIICKFTNFCEFTVNITSAESQCNCTGRALEAHGSDVQFLK